MRQRVDILVADDSDEDAALTLTALRRAAPAAKVLRVKDGRDAEHFLFATGGYQGRPPGLPQLILLDVNMPVVDGLAVLKTLRGDARTSEVPIVLLSSSSNPVLIELGKALGANEYRVKPVDAAAYGAAVGDIVRRWLPTSGAEPTSELRPLLATSSPGPLPRSR